MTVGIDDTTARRRHLTHAAGSHRAAVPLSTQVVASRHAAAIRGTVYGGGSGSAPPAAGERPLLTANPLLLYGINYAIGRVYDATAGPAIRQGTQAALRQKHTEPFIPPTTPGYLARDLAYNALGFLLIDKSFSWLVARDAVKHAGTAASAAAAKGASQFGMGLVSVGGLLGMNASVGSAATPAAIATSFQKMLGRTALVAAMVTALDAAYAATLGPRVESAVNKMFGKNESTDVKDIRGGVPLNTVRQTLEQASRQFARTFLGASAYTVVWKEAGLPMAAMVRAAIGGGPAAAIAGAVAGTLLTSVINHQIQTTLGPAFGDLAQGIVRQVKSVLGRPLDPPRKRDVVATMGDRVSNNARSVVVPLLTALFSGQMRAFTSSLGPAPPGR